LALDVHGVTWAVETEEVDVCVTGPYLSGAVGPP
jgi:hypothetical protein